MGQRDLCRQLVSPDYPVYIDKEVSENGCLLLEGHFMSPFKSLLPGIMPKEVELARFQMVLPREWKSTLRPICLHFGGTGDHGFTRRRKLIALPLLKEYGIASLILENPYYGCRKPKNQFRSSLLHVSDLFVMGGALILESLVMFDWLDKLNYGPLGTTGISMGGHMASLGATNWHKPLSLIPCMSGSTAAGVFTHGVLSTALPWKVLQQQYMDVDEYKTDIMDLIESPEPAWNSNNIMYREGRKFIKQLDDDYSCDNGNLLNDNHKCAEDNTLHIQSPNLAKNQLDDRKTDNLSNHFTRTPKKPDVKIEINSKNNSEICDIAATQLLVNQESSFNWKDSLSSGIAKLQSLYKWETEHSSVSSQQLELDCRHFMQGVMDECTHLANFSVPVDPELIVIVVAENDAYIPTKEYLKLAEIWPGSKVRTVPRGHIAGFLFARNEFRKAIADSFELHAAKYYNTQLRNAH